VPNLATSIPTNLGGSGRWRVQLDDEATWRQRMLEELLHAQTNPEKHLREIHLGLANIHEQQLLALRRQAGDSRRRARGTAAK
jgi:hypothetical protein